MHFIINISQLSIRTLVVKNSQKTLKISTMNNIYNRNMFTVQAIDQC